MILISDRDVCMSRRRLFVRRQPVADQRFGSKNLAKFINILMVSGKKMLAERIVYSALEIVSRSSGRDPVKLFEEILEKVRPVVEIRSRRVGGSTYQIPVEVRAARRDTLAMRWIIHSARRRRDKSMILKLSGELLDSLEGRGGAVKRREDVHRMAEANRAFAHYRW